MEKIFYSFTDREGYSGELPAYFKASRYPWVGKVEEAYPKIREELEHILEAGTHFRPYPNKKVSGSTKSWKTLTFMAWGIRYRSKTRLAPATMNVFRQIPGLVSVSINLLEPNGHIAPHYGDTSATMRGHLGMVIPGELPEIGFKVDGQERSWREGEVLLFCDAHQHEAWNHTASPRFILLFDIIRPEHQSKSRWICSRVLAALFLQRVGSKFPLLERTPRVLQGLIYGITIASFRIFVPIRNLF